MVNLTYQLDHSWRMMEWNSPDGSCDCSAYLGRSVLDAISEPTLSQLFRVALERVVKTEQPLELKLRCDTPVLRRDAYVRLMLLSRGGGIWVENGILRQVARPPVHSLEAGWISKHLVRMCSWCKKVEAARNRWIEIEQASKVMDLFQKRRPPALTHGLCGECYVQLARAVGLEPQECVSAGR